MVNVLNEFHQAGKVSAYKKELHDFFMEVTGLSKTASASDNESWNLFQEFGDFKWDVKVLSTYNFSAGIVQVIICNEYVIMINEIFYFYLKSIAINSGVKG